MTHQYEAMSQARRRLLGLMAGQALATTERTTEVLTQWVGTSLRTACSVWTLAVGLSAQSATARTVERTSIKDPNDVPRPVDEPSPVEDELSTEQRGGEEPSGEELTGEELTGEERHGVQPAADEVIDVVFRLPSAVNAEAAHVCGEFNDWSMTADPMVRLPDGSFELTRALPVGRRWRFRYLLDAIRWENDWAADDYVANDLGDQDSVVDLETPSASHLVTRD